ncbi:hypothetical protein R1flu_020415 [Riccia fluitans]|uniref:Uncharacterized protein n=1 Tax=Riccia fluitans TaxID=41844 RepID=A0ABD1ZLW4_9MARC
MVLNSTQHLEMFTENNKDKKLFKIILPMKRYEKSLAETKPGSLSNRDFECDRNMSPEQYTRMICTAWLHLLRKEASHSLVWHFLSECNCLKVDGKTIGKIPTSTVWKPLTDPKWTLEQYFADRGQAETLNAQAPTASRGQPSNFEGERANVPMTKDLTFKKYGKGMDPMAANMLDNWKKGKPISGDEGVKYQPICEEAKADTVGEQPLEIPVDHVKAFEGAYVQGSDSSSTAKLPIATVHEGVKAPLAVRKKTKGETNVAVVVEPLVVKSEKGSKRARLPPAKAEPGFNPYDVIIS